MEATQTDSSSLMPAGDRLIIVGSGNVAFNLYKFALILGYNITMIDDNPEMLNRERFPEAGDLLVGDIVQLLKQCPITPATSIVLLSHHHEFDKDALVAVIDSPARYIGIMGNKRKVTAYFSALETLGTDRRLIERVHIPIGLDLGGQLAAEIALAAMAEIQAVKYKRTGGFVAVKQASSENEKRDKLF